MNREESKIESRETFEAAIQIESTTLIGTESTTSYKNK